MDNPEKLSTYGTQNKKNKKTKTKKKNPKKPPKNPQHNMYWTPLYTQPNTNNVNKT
jgi:hypothetical protein